MFTPETLLRALLIKREGYRTAVYHDTAGRLTVGIGHRVVPADHLSLGEHIASERIEALYTADTAGAMAAARTQVAEAGIESAAFLAALAAVCFQLGDGWTREFPETWAAICAGDYAGAANMLSASKWARETPVRVGDFQGALRGLV